MLQFFLALVVWQAPSRRRALVFRRSPTRVSTRRIIVLPPNRATMPAVGSSMRTNTGCRKSSVVRRLLSRTRSSDMPGTIRKIYAMLNQIVTKRVSLSKVSGRSSIHTHHEFLDNICRRVVRIRWPIRDYNSWSKDVLLPMRMGRGPSAVVVFGAVHSRVGIHDRRHVW
jgi:hypothetical protein